jgi:hypothetical protein
MGEAKLMALIQESLSVARRTEAEIWRMNGSRKN